MSEEEKVDISNMKNPPELDGCPDMTMLTYLSEDHVLDNLHTRFKKVEMYSAMGNILLAVNPYQWCKIYGPDYIEKYRKNSVAKVPDHNVQHHVYAVAALAFKLLFRDRQNQSVLVCGESGAGKTETAKKLMYYLTETTQKNKKKGTQSKLEEQLMCSNEIMEAFGNAKTLWNNNSSRYGKFTKMLFAGSNHSDGRIIGVAIETYLLEKSRVTFQSKTERNFHVFFQIGKTFVGQKGIKKLSDFYYLNSTGDNAAAHDLPGRPKSYDQDCFEDLDGGLDQLEFSKELRGQIYDCILGLLHLGNVKFEGSIDESSVKKSTLEHLSNAAKLFGVDEARLKNRLLTKSIKVAGRLIDSNLGVEKAVINRDDISKEFYNALFLWLVASLNDAMRMQKNASTLFIGILDVAGFEKFKKNSFEQFCINFANEKLQQYFNDDIIKKEQVEYIAEGVYWNPINIPNNDKYIEMMTKHNRGLFALLDSACRQPKPSPAIYVDQVFNAYSSHPSIKRVKQRLGKRDRVHGFQILHYAGNVEYDCAEFLIKNYGSVHFETVDCFRSSKNNVASAVFKGKNYEVSHKSFKSIGSEFEKQVRRLMKELKNTNPQFVRCLNPNQNKSSEEYNREHMRLQLRCGGIIEALRVMKHGYPTRIAYKAIYDQFNPSMGGNKLVSDLDTRDFCEAMVVGFGLTRESYQMGKTKIFFRPGKGAVIQELKAWGDKPLSENHLERIRKWLLARRLARMRGRAKGFSKFYQIMMEHRWMLEQEKLAKNKKKMAILKKLREAQEKEIRRLQNLNRLINEQKAAIEAKDEEMKRLNKEHADRLDGNAQELEEQDQEFSNIANQKSEADSVLLRTKDEIEKLQRAIRDMQSLNERNMEDSNKKLENEINKKDQDFQRLEDEFNQRLAQTEKKIDELNNEINNEKNSTSQAEITFSNEQENTKRLEDKIEELQKNIQEEKDRNARQVRDRNMEIENANEDMEKLKEQFSKSQEDHSEDVTTRIDNIKSDQEKKDREYQKRIENEKETQRDIQGELDKREGMLQDKLKELRDFKNLIEKTKQNGERMGQEWDNENEAKLRELQRDVQTLLDEHNARLRELNKQLQDALNSNAQVELEKAETQEKCERDLGTMKLERDRLLDERTAMAERLAQLSKQYEIERKAHAEKFEHNLSLLLSEKSKSEGSLQDQIQRLLSQVSGLTSEVNKLKVENAEIDSQYQRFQSDAKAEILRGNALRTSLETRINDLNESFSSNLKLSREEHEKAITQLKSAKQTSDEKNQQSIAVLKDEIGKKILESEEYKQKEQKAKEISDSIQEQLTAAEQKLAGGENVHESTVQDLQRTCEQLKVEKQQLRERVQRMKKRMDTQLAEHQKLHNQALQELQEDHRTQDGLLNQRIQELTQELQQEHRTNSEMKIKVDNLMSKTKTALKTAEREAERNENERQTLVEKLDFQKKNFEDSMVTAKKGFSADLKTFEEEKKKSDVAFRYQIQIVKGQIRDKEKSLKAEIAKAHDFQQEYAHQLENEQRISQTLYDQLQNKDQEYARKVNELKKTVSRMLNEQRILNTRVQNQKNQFRKELARVENDFKDQLLLKTETHSKESQTRNGQLEEVKGDLESALLDKRNSEARLAEAKIKVEEAQRDKNNLELKQNTINQAFERKQQVAAKEKERQVARSKKLEERVKKAKERNDKSVKRREEEFAQDMKLFEADKEESEKQYQEQITDLKKTLDEVTKELEEKKSLKNNAQSELTEAEKKSESQGFKEVQLKQDVEKDITRLKKEKEQKIAEIHQHMDEAISLREEIYVLERESADMGNTVVKSDRQLLKKTREIRAMEAKLKRLQMESR